MIVSGNNQLRQTYLNFNLVKRKNDSSKSALANHFKWRIL